MSIILTDTRECNGALPYLDAIVAENNRANIKLVPNMGGGDIMHKVQQLTLGDYAIMLNNVLEAVFERKTWKDLSASIKDDRARSQQARLVNLKCAYPACLICYIIEGPMTYNDQYPIANIPFKNLHAKLRHNLIRGYPFIQTRDAQHTAHMLANFARDFMKLHAKPAQLPDISNYHEELRTLQQRYANTPSITTDATFQEVNKLCISINGISDIPIAINGISDIPIAINNILDTSIGDTVPMELTTRAVHTNADILRAMWDTLPGIADKTINIIMSKYHIAALLALKPERYLIIKRELSLLKLPDGAGLGAKKIATILSLCYFGGEMARIEALFAQSKKILACIPNLSLSTAAAILQLYSLRQICEGQVSEDMLASIAIGERHIGQKLAAMILSIFVN